MMWLLLFSANALASTASGFGLTPMGGGLAGITEPGPLGVVSTPASAHTESIEILLDVGANVFHLGGQLDGFERETYQAIIPMPYLGATMPIGDVGVGIYGMIPYGGGIELEPDTSHRFHARTSRSFLVELGLPVAYKITDWVTIGASFRAGHNTLNKNAAINTASLVNSKVGLDPALPLDNELLVGSQDLSIRGNGFGFGLGASFFLPNGVAFHLGYRSPMKTNLSGPVDIVPSDGIDARLNGNATTTMQFPTEIELGAVVPIGKTRIALMAGWVDWSVLSTIEIDVEDLQISSSEEALISLLTTTGLNESDLLAAGTDIKNDLGHTPVFHGGATVGVDIGDAWEIRPGVFYAPTTIPDSSFHLGIADFTSWNLRLSASHDLTRWLTTGLSYDHFFVNTRTIRTSGLSLGNDAETGRVLPSSNGIYDMNAQRVGLSLIARM